MNFYSLVFKRIGLLALTAVFLSTVPVRGATLAFAFSPTLESGSDPHGLGNAVWTFNFEVTQATYQTSGTFGDISFIADSAQLTISGASNGGLNGTHNINSTGTGNSFVFLPNFFGSTILAVQLPTNTVSSFSFGGVSVSNFGPVAAPAIVNPSIGDPVDVSVFNNADYTSSNMTVDGSQFSFDTSLPIPEPSATGFLLLSTLCMVLFHRARGRV